jgi:hypothetical protein
LSWLRAFKVRPRHQSRRGQRFWATWGEVNYAVEQLIDPYVDKAMLNNVLAKSWVPYRTPLPPRASDLPQSAK